MSTIHRSVTILYLKVIAFKNNGKSYAFFFKRSKNGYGYFLRSLINDNLLMLDHSLRGVEVRLAA